MTTLPTLIADLEEALKAATEGPWRQGQPDMTKVHPDWVDADGNSSEDCFHRNGFAKTIAVCKDPDFDIYDARLIALMRNSLPTLIEALKRQGEALEQSATKWHELGEAIENNGRFDDAGFCFAAARQDRAALTAHKGESDV